MNDFYKYPRTSVMFRVQYVSIEKLEIVHSYVIIFIIVPIMTTLNLIICLR